MQLRGGGNLSKSPFLERFYKTNVAGQAARLGFTLAEVLITLGIIGVVAAITMPTLIQNHKEKVAITQLKKTYSVLSQAMLSAVNEYGTADNWDVYSYEDEGENTVTRYAPVNLVSQLVVAKNCGFTSQGCFQSGVYKILNGNAERDFETLNTQYYKLVLSDGTILAIEGYEPEFCAGRNLCGEIFVDINGSKSPNVAGKDLFLFIYTNNRIIPSGYNENNLPLSRSGCNKRDYGYSCTAWVLAQENMDYLHCDDLSWTGKTKCK